MQTYLLFAKPLAVHLGAAQSEEYPECSEDPHVALDGITKQLRFSSGANHGAGNVV